jgi:hypothetical protein
MWNFDTSLKSVNVRIFEGRYRMKLLFHLDRVENLHEITVESDPGFYAIVQQGILLSLWEADQISNMQLRQAEENLLCSDDFCD